MKVVKHHSDMKVVKCYSELKAVGSFQQPHCLGMTDHLERMDAAEPCGWRELGNAGAELRMLWRWNCKDHHSKRELMHDRCRELR